MCVGAGKWCLKIAREWSAARDPVGPAGRRSTRPSARRSPSSRRRTFALEAVVDLSAQMADDDRNDIRIEAALAKLYGSEMGWLMADELVQIRGGRGFETAESLAARGERAVPAEQLLRDLRINRIFEGSTEIMHLLIAREAVDAHLSVAGDLIDPDKPLRQGEGRRERRRLLRHAGSPSWSRARASSPARTASSAGSPRASALRRAPARKLARSTFYAMSRWQGRMETKQGFLGRIVDIGAELFAMSAACVARRVLRARGEHGARPTSSPTPSAARRGSASRSCSPGSGPTPTTSTARWSTGSWAAPTPGWRRASSTPPATARGSPTPRRARRQGERPPHRSADRRTGAAWVHALDPARTAFAEAVPPPAGR